MVVTAQLAEVFRSHGHTVSIVVGEDSADPVFKDYHVVPVKPGSPWRERMRSYVQTVEATKPDMVYSTSGIDELDVHRFLAVPRIRHISSFEEHDYLSIPFLLKQAGAYCEAISVNDPDVLSRIQAIVPTPFVPVITLYHVAPRFFECPPPRPASGRPVEVCFVGRLDAYQKRTDWLPDIIAGCAKRGARLKWHIYGEGPLKEPTARRVAKMGLAADVQFHGWVKTDELVARMSSHDIFFMCSRWEGVPMATIEAMFCGLACVVPAIPGGLVYLVGRGGAVYPASGPEAASIALSALAEKPEALFQAKVLARERARELFARAAISEQYDRLESEARRLRFNQRVLDVNSSRPLQHVELSTVAKRILLRPLRIARRLRQSLP